MPKLKCERGEVYVWNPRQFYQKIVCPMCDERGGGHKELTVPHFRKHLEQVHTMEEVESVKVCRVCHRDAVQAKADRFDGLVSVLPGRGRHWDGFFLGFWTQIRNPGFGLGFGSKILDSGFRVGFWVRSWVLEPKQTHLSTIYKGKLVSLLFLK